MPEIPLSVSGISPVPAFPPLGGPPLPLSLIAYIISYIDDVADLAALTRTTRLMYYMTLPYLYERVTLQSYSELRYRDGRPEGFGGGSPFAMALSGLAVGNTAGLVKEFVVTGSWSEPKMDEYTKGTIPDSTILLGIAIRTAIDRMAHLRSFAWSLDIKPTLPIYTGLGARSTLTSLELRFPQSRSPRPVSTIPSMPGLRRLRVSDLDPLCYPDDLSVLLLHAKKLEDLRIQWSPRMRSIAEPSINLRTIFGRCLEANYKLPLKHFGMQNFYGAHTGELSEIPDTTTLESAVFLEVFGGNYLDPKSVWLANTWKRLPGPEYYKSLRRVRVSETAPEHARMLESRSGLEEFYIVGRGSCSSDKSLPVSPTSTTTPDVSGTPGRNHESSTPSICKQYVHVLASHHGQTLRKLLLSDQWALSGSQISIITSSCPNLEQLGFAPGADARDALQLLSPFMTRLRVLRLLKNEYIDILSASPNVVQLSAGIRDPPVYWKMGNSSMRWVGIGDKVVKVCEAFQQLDEEGKLEWHSEVRLATSEDVKHVDVWKLDCMEL